MTFDITPATSRDIAALAAIVEETGLFPPEMLPDLLASPDAQWRAARQDGALLGFAFAALEAMTDTAWNLRALGVRSSARRQGAALALLAEVEAALAGLGARVLVIDTADGEGFAPARALYLGAGYAEQPAIPAFWSAD
ncbi:MAG: GNAT family N-acetyltransferase, partial [Pseudomonadota bacterium]